MSRSWIIILALSMHSFAIASPPVAHIVHNAPNSGGPFTSSSGGIVWDNWPANGDNGYRPTANWDPQGMIDNFELKPGNSTFSDMRVEFVDGTFPLDVPDTTHAAMRLQVFELPPGGMAALRHPDEDGGDIPIFDRTYTRASGAMVVSDSGGDYFDRDMLYFDVTGEPTDLGPGEYVAFVTFPGSGPIDSYWMSSDHPFVVGQTEARILGPYVNSSFTTPFDLAFNLSIPEPTSLMLCAIGAIAITRRRRGANRDRQTATRSKSRCFTCVLIMGWVCLTASTVNAASDSTFGDNPGRVGGTLSQTHGGIVWDNWTANGVNAQRPSDGWDVNGMIDDFELSAGDSMFSGMRVEFVDGTFPLDVPDTTLDALRLRIFDIPIQGMAGIVHPDVQGGSIPIYDYTYTRASGEMTVTDSGENHFDRDLLYFDVTGGPVDLGPGDYAVFVTFPGTDVLDSYWMWSDHPFVHGVTESRVLTTFGQIIGTTPSDLAWNLSIPEPATITLLALGICAIARRRYTPAASIETKKGPSLSTNERP